MSTTIRMADGDFFVNSAGRTESIEGPSKAAQDIGEILMTPLDADRDYGNELEDLDMPPQISMFAGEGLISKKVDEAIQRLRRFQRRDPYAEADERIEKIRNLVVQTIGSGSFFFWVNCELEDETITPSRVLAVSLRHQESAQVGQTMPALLRKIAKLNR